MKRGSEESKSTGVYIPAQGQNEQYWARNPCNHTPQSWSQSLRIWWGCGQDWTVYCWWCLLYRFGSGRGYCRVFSWLYILIFLGSMGVGITNAEAITAVMPAKMMESFIVYCGWIYMRGCYCVLSCLVCWFLGRMLFPNFRFNLGLAPLLYPWLTNLLVHMAAIKDI